MQIIDRELLDFIPWKKIREDSAHIESLGIKASALVSLIARNEGYAFDDSGIYLLGGTFSRKPGPFLRIFPVHNLRRIKPD